MRPTDPASFIVAALLMTAVGAVSGMDPGAKSVAGGSADGVAVAIEFGRR